MRLGQDMAMAMGHDHVHGPTGPDLFAADDQRDLQLTTGHVFQRSLELDPLGRTGGVAQDGLVDGCWDLGADVHSLNLIRSTTVRCTWNGSCPRA